MRLEDRVAVVTGGGAGIGRAICVLFAREGAKLVVADILAESARETVEIIRATDGSAVAIKADVTVAPDVQNMIAAATESYGRLDVLVNNAGVGVTGDVVELSGSDWSRVFDVNAKGTFTGMKYALPAMLKAGGGSIVNIASIFAFLGGSVSCAYPASKAAIVALSRSTAVKYAAANIRVNCICPGHVETALTYTLKDPWVREELRRKYPIGRFGRPEEIAQAALFLASEESSFITGTELIVDGGYSAQ